MFQPMLKSQRTLTGNPDSNPSSALFAWGVYTLIGLCVGGGAAQDKLLRRPSLRWTLQKL